MQRLKNLGTKLITGIALTFMIIAAGSYIFIVTGLVFMGMLGIYLVSQAERLLHKIRNQDTDTSGYFTEKERKQFEEAFNDVEKERDEHEKNLFI